MPDAFFQKKRKRPSFSSGPSASSSSSSKPSRSTKRGSSTIASNSSSRMRKRGASGGGGDDDESDDDSDAVPGGGIDEMDLTHDYNTAINTDDEAEAAETPAEARVRLAKMYLSGLASSSSSSRPTTGNDGDDDDFFEHEDHDNERGQFGLADAAESDRQNIAARLQKDVAQNTGKLHIFVSDRIALPTPNRTISKDKVQLEHASVNDGCLYNTMLAVRGHRLSVTSAVASSDAKWLFTASKDGFIIRWRLRDGKMVRIFPKRSKVLSQQSYSPITTIKNNNNNNSNRSKSSGAARRRARLTKSSNTCTNNNTSIYLSLAADEGHTDEIWTLCVSSDGKFVASGGKDKRVCIWDSSQPCSERFIKSLGGHKDSISCVTFRSGSNELYTASLDRTIKLYDVSQLSYIETLFGHQESILSLSCLGAETAVSAGGRDRTCRYWKIRDESQLVFRAGIKSKLRSVLEGGDLISKLNSGDGDDGDQGGKMSNPTEAMEASVEVVCMIDSHHFLSGGDSGSIALWNLGKKKPIFSVAVAHGFQVTKSETEGEIRTPRWITALSALAYGDVFVSGSWDGIIRIWGLTTSAGQVKGFRQLFQLQHGQGVVNSLQIISSPISSVVIKNSTKGEQAEQQEVALETRCIRSTQYKRQYGLEQNLSLKNTNDTDQQQQQEEEEEEERMVQKLDRIHATKENCPPIIIAGIGQEHKFGRWIKVPNAKNGTLIIPLRLTHLASSRIQ